MAAKRVLYCVFRLGLYWTLDCVSLSGQSVKICWVSCNTSCAETFVGRCSVTNCKLGPSLWNKCLVRHDLVIKFWGSCVLTRMSFNSSARFTNRELSQIWIINFPKMQQAGNVSNCHLQPKSSNGEVMQRKWPVYSARKFQCFAVFARFFQW